jgi:hypothetical protein
MEKIDHLEIEGMILRKAIKLSWITGLALGAWLLGKQIWIYLKNGLWIPQGILDYLGIELDWKWAIYPDDWVGLHIAINSLNAGVACLIAGGLISLIFTLMLSASDS